MSSVSPKVLLDLFLSTAKIGAVSFGGGYAMIPIMEQEFVHKNKWVDGADILDIFAIAQSVPGVIALNTSTFIGYRVAGLPGAIVASFGVSLPSFVIISILSGFYMQFKANPIVNAAFAGIRACVVALVFTAVLKMGESAVKDIFGWIIALAGLIAIAFFGIQAIWCIIAGGVIGAIYSTMIMKNKVTDDKKAIKEGK